MGGIFISYRREDSADICGRLYDHLIARYGKPAVFKDVDSIPFGEDFPTYIQKKLSECSVCLAVIGPRWFISAAADGQPRLYDPSDSVRLEIETALQLGLVVIPVLAYGVTMPPTQMLPGALARLPYLNAAYLRLDPDFTPDVSRLCEVIDRFVPPRAALPFALPLGRAPRPLSPSARKRIRIGIAAAVLLSLLLVGGVIHWHGPADTIRSFIQADTFSPSAAAVVQANYPLLCPDVQARLPESLYLSRLQGAWDTHEGATTRDLSHMTFTIEDESLTEAHVRIGGYYTSADRSGGATTTFTIGSSNPRNLHTVRASGLGWCLTGDILPSAILNG